MMEDEDIKIFIIGLTEMTKAGKIRWNAEMCNTFCARMTKDTSVTLSMDDKRIGIICKSIDIQGSWIVPNAIDFDILLETVIQTFQIHNDEARAWVEGFCKKNLLTNKENIE